jgi:subtilisin family serine protease
MASLDEEFPADDMLAEDMGFFFDKLNSLRERSAGEGVLVALLDSGVNADKVDVLSGYDFAGESRWSDDEDADYSDPTGHGTGTAGVISSTAEEAGILAVKVMDDIGKTTNSILAEGIRWAVEQGARVLAMPLTLTPVNSLVTSAIEYALDQGAMLVASAGNGGTSIAGETLAAQDGIITVGSVNNDGKLSAWSNIGEEVDLYAPWDVIETGEREAGTSFSAAFVAGIAALMLEDEPDMTADEILGELKVLMADVQPDIKARGERQETRGESVDEVVNMYEMLRKNRREFTGTSPKVEYKEMPAQE